VRPGPARARAGLPWRELTRCPVRGQVRVPRKAAGKEGRERPREWRAPQGAAQGQGPRAAQRPRREGGPRPRPRPAQVKGQALVQQARAQVQVRPASEPASAAVAWPALLSSRGQARAASAGVLGSPELRCGLAFSPWRVPCLAGPGRGSGGTRAVNTSTRSTARAAAARSAGAGAAGFALGAEVCLLLVWRRVLLHVSRVGPVTCVWLC